MSVADVQTISLDEIRLLVDFWESIFLSDKDLYKNCRSILDCDVIIRPKQDEDTELVRRSDRLQSMSYAYQSISSTCRSLKINTKAGIRFGNALWI